MFRSASLLLFAFALTWLAMAAHAGETNTVLDELLAKQSRETQKHSATGNAGTNECDALLARLSLRKNPAAAKLVAADWSPLHALAVFMDWEAPLEDDRRFVHDPKYPNEIQPGRIDVLPPP